MIIRNILTILTTIIGFLLGTVIYLSSEAGFAVIFLTGCVAYFIGLILDEFELKHRNQLFSFSNLEMNEKIFYPEEIPVATVIYSLKENRTTVIMDLRVDAKPQNFRLSVLKNLTKFEFRVSEDALKTIFSLTLDFPDLNYPVLIQNPKQLTEFHLSLKERLEDFKATLLKIIPGLVISSITKSELLEIDSGSNFLTTEYQNPPSSLWLTPKQPSAEITFPDGSSSTNKYDSTSEINNFNNKESESGIEQIFKSSSEVEEDFILEDLNQSNIVVNPELIDPKVDIPSEEIQNLKNSNNKYFDAYLEEGGRPPMPFTTSILSEEVITDQATSQLSIEPSKEPKQELEIDYSKVQNIGSSDELFEKFNKNFTNKIENQLNKQKDKSLQEQIQKEKSIISKNY